MQSVGPMTKFGIKNGAALLAPHVPGSTNFHLGPPSHDDFIMRQACSGESNATTHNVQVQVVAILELDGARSAQGGSVRVVCCVIIVWLTCFFLQADRTHTNLSLDIADAVHNDHHIITVVHKMYGTHTCCAQPVSNQRMYMYGSKQPYR